MFKKVQENACEKGSPTRAINHGSNWMLRQVREARQNNHNLFWTMKNLCHHPKVNVSFWFALLGQCTRTRKRTLTAVAARQMIAICHPSKSKYKH